MRSHPKNRYAKAATKASNPRSSSTSPKPLSSCPLGGAVALAPSIQAACRRTVNTRKAMIIIARVFISFLLPVTPPAGRPALPASWGERSPGSQIDWCSSESRFLCRRRCLHKFEALNRRNDRHHYYENSCRCTHHGCHLLAPFALSHRIRFYYRRGSMEVLDSNRGLSCQFAAFWGHFSYGILTAAGRRLTRI